MTAETTTSFIINALAIIIAIALIMRGKILRDKKSSKGISASSNETSTGTAFIICGLVLLITQVIKLSELMG